MTGKDAVQLRGFFRAQDRTNRLILLLHYVDRLTPAEIGSVLRLSEIQVTESLSKLQNVARRVLEPQPALG